MYFQILSELKMSKRKSLIPAPNQPSIKAFIAGGSVGWRPGQSPLLGGSGKKQDTEINKFEKNIHDKLVAAGVFNHYLNQPAALAYLNGQFILRRKYQDKIQKFENSVNNFLKSGVTKRFLKVPAKVLPKDKSNCEQEVVRSTKVATEIELFRKELLLMKKHCLDEEHSIKPKKREEYEYYSYTIDVIEGICDKLEDIRTKLSETNLVINMSGGRVTKAVSVLENKRIMKRKKENSKIITRKAFNRDVESLKRFLSKYTSSSFDEIFNIAENKTFAPANHFAKKRLEGKVSEVVTVDDSDCELGLEEDDDIAAQWNSPPKLDVECFNSLIDADDGTDDDVTGADMMVSDGTGAVVVDIEGTQVEEDVSVVVDENSNSIIKDKKRKHQNVKIERSIVPNRKLAVKDFASLEFDKKDLKSLNILVRLEAAEKSLKEFIDSKCQEWQLEKSEKEEEGDAHEIALVAELVRPEPEEEQIVKEVAPEEKYHEVKGLKKKYKTVIKCVLDEHGNKMRRKKLKKKVIERSGEFDEGDEAMRGDLFERFIVKVKDVVADGKYVLIVNKD